MEARINHKRHSAKRRISACRKIQVAPAILRKTWPKEVIRVFVLKCKCRCQLVQLHSQGFCKRSPIEDRTVTWVSGLFAETPKFEVCGDCSCKQARMLCRKRNHRHATSLGLASDKHFEIWFLGEQKAFVSALTKMRRDCSNEQPRSHIKIELKWSRKDQNQACARVVNSAPKTIGHGRSFDSTNGNS
jgi:hypothetical protein